MGGDQAPPRAKTRVTELEQARDHHEIIGDVGTENGVKTQAAQQISRTAQPPLHCITFKFHSADGIGPC